MLLGACLIGYAIGWALREGPIELLQEEVDQLNTDKDNLISAKDTAERNLESSRQELATSKQVQQESGSRNQRIVDEHKEQIAGLKSELAEARKTQTPVEGKSTEMQALEGEHQTLRYQFKQLEFQNQELSANIQKLKIELETAHAQKKVSVEPMHPFVRPVSEEEKDDLTQIKGIGPFIEKRLNMVGIYTLQQISEFTPEVIEQVTKAIEFFPDRMIRDNWVGQAKRLVGNNA